MLLLFLHEGDGVELRTVVAIVAFSNCAQRNRVEGRVPKWEFTKIADRDIVP